MDTSADGLVDWSDFCTYLLMHLREKEFLASKENRQPIHSLSPRVRWVVPNKVSYFECV